MLLRLVFPERHDMRFLLGRTVATPGALKEVGMPEMVRALARHVRGDWGEVCPEDAEANETALREDLRLLSVYRSEGGVRFYVITEWDRSATTVLLPEEY